MFCAGSLMSQVLQWTQFCALMTKRGSAWRRLVGVDDLVDARRAIEPRRLAVSGADCRESDASGSRRRKMDRLIFLVIGVREKDRRGFVECEIPSGLG